LLPAGAWDALWSVHDSLRKHVSYANIVATLALVFAMSGAAVAANHYLINSTKQINPKVIKKLKGNTGKAGTIGPAGPTGATGPKGAEGPAGQSALSPLRSGQSESGDYGIRAPGGAKGEYLAQSVTFPIPLEHGVATSQVVYTRTGTATHCAGPGHADAGFLCICSGKAEDIEAPTIYSFEQVGSATLGTGRYGFDMESEVTLNNAYDVGTYTVTAP